MLQGIQSLVHTTRRMPSLRDNKWSFSKVFSNTPIIWITYNFITELLSVLSRTYLFKINFCLYSHINSGCILQIINYCFNFKTVHFVSLVLKGQRRNKEIVETLCDLCMLRVTCPFNSPQVEMGSHLGGLPREYNWATLQLQRWLQMMTAWKEIGAWGRARKCQVVPYRPAVVA